MPRWKDEIQFAIVIEIANSKSTSKIVVISMADDRVCERTAALTREQINLAASRPSNQIEFAMVAERCCSQKLY
jgi:hypothetical protein